MEITKKYIEDIKFTVIKNRYYDGQEVDSALDEIADGVDSLCIKIAQLQKQLDEKPTESPLSDSIPVIPSFDEMSAAMPASAPVPAASPVVPVFPHEPVIGITQSRTADETQKQLELKKQELEREIESLKEQRDRYKEQTEDIIRYAAKEVLKLVDGD